MFKKNEIPEGYDKPDRTRQNESFSAYDFENRTAYWNLGIGYAENRGG